MEQEGVPLCFACKVGVVVFGFVVLVGEGGQTFFTVLPIHGSVERHEKTVPAQLVEEGVDLRVLDGSDQVQQRCLFLYTYLVCVASKQGFDRLHLVGVAIGSRETNQAKKVTQ